MDNFIQALLQILSLLSSEADEQIKYLESIGDASVDELGLEFEEIALIAPLKLEAGELTEEQYLSIQILDEKLDELSGNDKAGLWTKQALVSDGEWGIVRYMAANCLALFPQTPTQPTQGHP